MEASSIDADLASLISTLESYSISTPALTREVFSDARRDIAVPCISHEEPHTLKSLHLDLCVNGDKRVQRPDGPSQPKDVKRTCKPRGNRLRGRGKPPLLSLPVELRLVIFRMVLGDRKVHVHYKQGLHSDLDSSIPKMKKMAFIQYLPQYVFCHHGAFTKDPPLRRAMRSIKRYDNHHNFCNLPGTSLDKKLESNFHDPGPFGLGRSRGGLPRPPPESIIPSPESIELMYESFELQLSMFAVSHQLREEAMEVYYKTNTFSFATATYFNIFLSRITHKKASLLRKLDLIYDLGEFASYQDKLLSSSPMQWQLGVLSPSVLKRLADITGITIRYCNLFPERETPLIERLRKDFGGLGRLKSVTRVNVRVYQDTCPEYSLLSRSKPPLDKNGLKDIGDKFAKEILSG